jgi:choline kinase
MAETPDTAVILAAGIGDRMGEDAGGRPKGFLTIGGKPIVLRSIENLRQAGISRILVVTGFGAECYEELARRIGPGVEIVHNERFAATGSMRSFTCATDRCDRPFLLLESDLIYERRAIEIAMATAANEAILASEPTRAGDEVWIETDDDDNLIAMSKDRGRLGPRVIGELVGITKVSTRLRRAMLNAAESLDADTRAIDYEAGLTAATAELRIHCHLVRDLIWAEIDTADHLARARDVVYPRMLELGAG